MKRFIAVACLLIASVHSAILPNGQKEETNLETISFVKMNLESVEKVLSALETQINYEATFNPKLRDNPSETSHIREDISELFNKLKLVRHQIGNVEKQMSKPKRIRREVEQRQNALVDTTTTLVQSASTGIQGTMQSINGLMLNLNHGVNNLFTRITNQITSLAVSTNNALTQGVNSIGQGTNNAILGVNNAATNVVNGVSNAVQNTVQNINQVAQNSYQTATGVIQGAVNSATSTVNRLTG